jgi:hypothetical protein
VIKLGIMEYLAVLYPTVIMLKFYRDSLSHEYAICSTSAKKEPISCTLQFNKVTLTSKML